MDLKSRIVTYILKHAPVSMTDLVSVTTSKGFTEQEVLSALTGIDKDKRITVTATASGEVVYKLSNSRVKATPSTSHLSWVTQHYPWPTHFIMPFPEIDLGAMFLRTKEERDAYMAEASGRPLYMTKKNYGR